MQVTVEITSGLGRRINIMVPEQEVVEKVNKQLNKIIQTANLPGFRPGKAPRRLIEERYGDSVRREALGDLIQTSLTTAIEQEKLKPAGMPSIENFDPEIKTGPLKYSAVFEVYPEIKVVSLTDAKVEKLNAEIAEKDVDAILEKMRSQHRTWEEVNRPAQEQDKVEIDFVGTINGEAFAGGQADAFEVVIGEKRTLPEFEQGIIGAKAGDVLNIKVPFPEAYQEQSLAGKIADFKITVKKVLAPKLPEINDDFALLFNVKEGGLEALRKEVRTNMGRELAQRIHDRLKDAVITRLLELNAIDAPTALVQAEIAHSKRAFFERAGMKEQIKPELLAMIPDDKFKDEAVRRVKVGLLFNHLISDGKMQADADKVWAKINDIASVYDEPEQMQAWLRSQKDQLRQIEALVLEDQVIEKLLSVAKVTEKIVPYAEIMELTVEK